MADEKGLKYYLDNPDMKIKQIMEYTDEQLADDSPDGQRKVKELSSMLRRARKPRIAAQVAEKLYKKTKTPDDLNLYFVAVVDAGDEATIRDVDNQAAEWVKVSDADAEESKKATPEQRRHLNATRLKAANKVRDNAMFETAYAEIPKEDKKGNEYIVNQYYVHLERNKRYQEIVEDYPSLNPDVREDTRIVNRYKAAEIQVGPSVFLIGSDSSSLFLPEMILGTLRTRVKKVTGSDADILKTMEEDNSGSRVAVVHGAKFDQFTWGYFFGKVGASNLIVLLDEGDKEENIPSCAGKKPHILSGNPMDWKEKLAERLTNSGLSVYSE